MAPSAIGSTRGCYLEWGRYNDATSRYQYKFWLYRPAFLDGERPGRLDGGESYPAHHQASPREGESFTIEGPHNSHIGNRRRDFYKMDRVNGLPVIDITSPELKPTTVSMLCVTNESADRIQYNPTDCLEERLEQLCLNLGIGRLVSMDIVFSDEKEMVIIFRLGDDPDCILTIDISSPETVRKEFRDQPAAHIYIGLHVSVPRIVAYDLRGRKRALDAIQD